MKFIYYIFIKFIGRDSNILVINKISETLKIDYKIDEKELSRINKNSDDISEKSSSIIKNIQDTVKNFNTFDIS